MVTVPGGQLGNLAWPPLFLGASLCHRPLGTVRAEGGGRGGGPRGLQSPGSSQCVSFILRLLPGPPVGISRCPFICPWSEAESVCE